ncbi:MAG: hypothetical protein OEM83_07245 [Gammaproteobacteria bacterium]|nr:hypothetical protein [Gammaproteobacteria bacterium]
MVTTVVIPTVVVSTIVITAVVIAMIVRSVAVVVSGVVVIVPAAAGGTVVALDDLAGAAVRCGRTGAAGSVSALGQRYAREAAGEPDQDGRENCKKPDIHEVVLSWVSVDEPVANIAQPL